jgi:hypothetical protein
MMGEDGIEPRFSHFTLLHTRLTPFSHGKAMLGTGGFAMRSSTHRFLFWVSSLAVASLALGACHFGHHDPSKHVDRVAARLERKLDLRDDQKPALAALRDDLKAQLLARQQRARQLGADLKSEFSKDTTDIDRAAGLTLDFLGTRLGQDQQKALVERAVAFYKVLDQAQQKTLNAIIVDRLEWLE